jgi:hypothetical protein
MISHRQVFGLFNNLKGRFLVNLKGTPSCPFLVDVFRQPFCAVMVWLYMFGSVVFGLLLPGPSDARMLGILAGNQGGG